MKLFFKTSVVAIACIAATSCTSDKTDIESVETTPRKFINFSNADAAYYGAEGNNDAYFTIDLTDGNKKLHLEFYGDPVNDFDEPVLKTGSYSIAEQAKAVAGTYIPGSGDKGSVYSETDGSDGNKYNITEGVFSISLSDGVYKIAIELKDETDNVNGSYTGPITVRDMRAYSNDFISGFMSFYGDDTEDGTHMFWVGFNSDGIVWDSLNGLFTGNGSYVRFYLVTGPDAFRNIPDGTYPITEMGMPGEILILDNYTYYAEIVNDVETTKSITSGTVTFQRTEDIYEVVMDFTDINGDNYKKYYKGELEYSNYSGELIEDLDMGEFASGKMTFFGNLYVDAYKFEVVLFGPGMSMDDRGAISGTGYVFFTDIYSVMDSNTDITPGTYVPTDNWRPGTIREGEQGAINSIGTYIYEYKDGRMINNPVYAKGGTLTVSGANPNYDFQIALTDVAGYNIIGSYKGGLDYIDESSFKVIFPETSPSDRYVFNLLNVRNWRDTHNTGATNLELIFSNNDMTLIMDTFTVDIGFETTPPLGTYVFSNDFTINTFSHVSNVQYQDFYFDVEGGVMTIALDNEGNLLYTMDLDMGWKGMFYAQYEVLAPDNINVTKFNGGNLIYYGNMYRPESNEYIARMYGEGVSVDNWFYVGTGCVFVLDFYTDLSATTGIPAGVYNIAESYDPGSIHAGASYSYYAEIIDGTIVLTRPLASGSASVSKSGNTYTIDMDFIDDNDKSIKGRFVGELEFNDRTE